MEFFKQIFGKSKPGPDPTPEHCVIIHFDYGSTDLSRLLEAIRPVLESAEFMNGARAQLRFGPPEDGVREEVRVIRGGS